MGFLDRIKEQASVLADRAQDLGKVGQERVGQVQGKAKANSLLRDLGTAVYAERTGKASSAASAQISRVMGELSQLEASGVVIPSPSSTASPSSSTVDLSTTTSSTTVVSGEPLSSSSGTAATVTGSEPGTPITGRNLT